MITLSDAISIVPIQESNYFEITNMISGKCFKVDSATVKVLYGCANKSDKDSIKDQLLHIGYSLNEADTFIQTMINSNFLLSENNEDIIEFTHYNHPLLGIKQLDVYKIINNSICIIGLPFGNGNFVDTRCKCFPSHFRNFTNNLFSYKNIISNINSLNFKSISNYFNINNFTTLVCSERVVDCGDLIYAIGEDNSVYHHKILNLYSIHIFSHKHIPISIGGDHSITYPILKALNASHETFDLVQFDAHADFKTSEIMNHYLKLEILNHANVINYCTLLENLTNIYQIGVREPFITHHNKIHNISIDEVRKKDTEWMKLVNSNRPIYISIDVDVFDPSILSGTANKLPNGIFYDEATLYLKELISNHPILGIDIVEANHKLDTTGMTTHMVKNIILLIISLLTPNT